MDEKSKKKFGLLLRWPKAFRRQPPDAAPIDVVTDEDKLIADVFRRANEEAEELDHAKKRRLRNRIAILTASIIGLAVLAFAYITELHQRLTAPDHVIKTHEAQQRIIYGPVYEGLKTRHPDQPVIPPMDRYNNAKERNP